MNTCSFQIEYEKLRVDHADTYIVQSHTEAGHLDYVNLFYYLSITIVVSEIKSSNSSVPSVPP